MLTPVFLLVSAAKTLHAAAGMATIIDVARAAGVSTATVSRALSRPEALSDETRVRVLAAVDALNYAPNSAARMLRTLRASKILVTVPDISNPFFAQIISGAEEAARDADYAVMLGDTRNDPQLEDLYAGMLHRREVDGLIFLGHNLPGALNGTIDLANGRAPVVNGCEYTPGLPVSSVHIDNCAAAAEAMAHLIGYGHRKIGIITGPMDSPIGQDRLKGVEHSAGLADVEIVVLHGDYSVESGHGQACALISQDVTAIFCFSDEMAVGALRAIRQTGHACPQDISLVGFDDIRFARFLEPPLTTVSQPCAEIGRQTVRLLLGIIAGNQTRPINMILPHNLVARGSTGPAPRSGS